MFLSEYIKVFPNIINLNCISTLIKYSNSLEFKKAAIGHSKVDEKIRKVKLHSLLVSSQSLTDVHWNNFLGFKIVNAMNEYLNNFNCLQYLKINFLNQLDILKYEEDNYYTFHVDASPTHLRTLSSILFLNNDYKGGDIKFKFFNEEEKVIKPTPGMLLVWPSNFMFPHSVEPVTEGIRYSIVAWA
jgi:predicted 2-oxoglutarate/Fe(II)-dependent dioxygenase YbiX